MNKLRYIKSVVKYNDQYFEIGDKVEVYAGRLFPYWIKGKIISINNYNISLSTQHGFAEMDFKIIKDMKLDKISL